MKHASPALSSFMVSEYYISMEEEAPPSPIGTGGNNGWCIKKYELSENAKTLIPQVINSLVQLPSSDTDKKKIKRFN